MPVTFLADCQVEIRRRRVDPNTGDHPGRPRGGSNRPENRPTHSRRRNHRRALTRAFSAGSKAVHLDLSILAIGVSPHCASAFQPRRCFHNPQPAWPHLPAVLMGLIVINKGLELGVIPPRVFCMLVIMAVVTTVMTCPLMLRTIPGTELEPLVRRSGFLRPV